jgi:hypothetical protein
MTDAIWPATLPPRPLADGYSLKFGNGAVRTNMDSGPPKVRKRFTAAVEPVGMVFRLTRAQVAILRAFYRDDCAYGAIPFQLVEPITGETRRFNFVEAPAVVPASRVKFDATLRLEALPA